MNEIVNTQTWLFLVAIEIGILLGMFYDLIRIFRKIIKHPNWITQVEDILYWVICMMLSFGVLYVHNFAEIRVFVFLGMILGAVFYFCTFSIVFMKIATWIIELLRRVIQAIVEALMVPIKWLIGVLKIPVRFARGQMVQLGHYNTRQIRKAKRRIYYMEADLKSGIKVNKNKNIYNKPKND